MITEKQIIDRIEQGFSAGVPDESLAFESEFMQPLLAPF